MWVAFLNRRLLYRTEQHNLLQGSPTEGRKQVSNMELSAFVGFACSAPGTTNERVVCLSDFRRASRGGACSTWQERSRCLTDGMKPLLRRVASTMLRSLQPGAGKETIHSGWIPVMAKSIHRLTHLPLCCFLPPWV